MNQSVEWNGIRVWNVAQVVFFPKLFELLLVLGCCDDMERYGRYMTISWSGCQLRRQRMGESSQPEKEKPQQASPTNTTLLRWCWMVPMICSISKAQSQPEAHVSVKAGWYKTVFLRKQHCWAVEKQFRDSDLTYCSSFFPNSGTLSGSLRTVGSVGSGVGFPGPGSGNQVSLASRFRELGPGVFQSFAEGVCSRFCEEKYER